MSGCNSIFGCVALLCASHLLYFSCSASRAAVTANGLKPEMATEHTVTQAEQTASARILFAGDAMQHQAQLDAALAAGGGKVYDYSDCFRLIAPLVSEADYAVVNLEVPLGGGPRYSGYPRFSAPDSYALALKDAGFDLFLLANNHILDSGANAAYRTYNRLGELGVDRMGIYADSIQRPAETPLIRDVNGFKVAFLNYTYGTNGIKPASGIVIPLTLREEMSSDIERAHKNGAEIVCVLIHWGQEYVMLPGGNQKSMTDFLFSKGVDLVIGSHPHVVQPAEFVDNPVTGRKSLVVYSLGNLISNMKTAETLGGMLVDVELYRDSEGKAQIGASNYYTHFTAKPDGRGTNYKVVPSWSDDSVVPATQRSVRKNTERIMEKVLRKHNKGVERGSVR